MFLEVAIQLRDLLIPLFLLLMIQLTFQVFLVLPCCLKFSAVQDPLTGRGGHPAGETNNHNISTACIFT